jgi:arylsulfatase A
MPEKTEEMKKTLFEVWKKIEAEGPKEWWLNERQKPAKGGKLNY